MKEYSTSMITTVTGKNQVSIPAEIAHACEIHPGTRLEWSVGKTPNTLTVKIHPSVAQVANELMGAGRRYLKPGEDPVANLIKQREMEDREREQKT